MKIKILTILMCLFVFSNVKAEENAIINNEVVVNEKVDNEAIIDKKRKHKHGEKKDFDLNKTNIGLLKNNCEDLSIDGKELNLFDLIRIGICNNPSLRKEFMNIQISESQLKQIRAEYMPSVYVNANTRLSHSKVEKSKSTETRPYGYGASLSWLIYDFGGRGARNKNMQALYDSSKFVYNYKFQDLVLKINAVYFNVLGAKEILKSAETNEVAFGTSYRESSKKYEIGSASLNDKLQAKTSYEKSTLEVIDAKNKVKKYMGDLAVLLNLSPDTELNLVGLPNDVDSMISLEKDETIENLMDIALKSRFELKEKESDLNAKKYSLKDAKSSRLPTIKLNADSSYSDKWKSGPYSRDSYVGVSFEMPIFTGMSISNSISEAKYKYQQAKFDLKDTENTIKNEVWTNYQDYLTAVESYNLSKQILESAEENEKVAFKSYEVGKVDIINLLTATSQLADARQQKINAFYDVLVSKINLYRAIGRF